MGTSERNTMTTHEAQSRDYRTDTEIAEDNRATNNRVADYLIDAYNGLIELENQGFPETDRLKHEQQKQELKALAIKYDVTLPIRRLIANSPSNGENAQSGMLILAPIFLVLMLLFFMFRKPLGNLLKESPKPSFTRPRGIQKKAPIFHSVL